jgi:hypothetical protein
MKKTTQLTILAIILFILVIVTSIYSCCSFEPYKTDNVFENLAKYEGYENIATPSSLVEKVNGSLVNPKITEKEEESFKLEGFEGLQPSLFNKNEEIDTFSKTDGSLSCTTDTFGLQNQHGGLCLSEEQKQLMRTRGGNATGSGTQVGSPK